MDKHIPLLDDRPIPSKENTHASDQILDTHGSDVAFGFPGASSHQLHAPRGRELAIAICFGYAQQHFPDPVCLSDHCFFVLAIFSFCGTPFAIEEKWLKPLRASSFPTVLWAACLIWLVVSFVVPAGVLLMSGINGAPPTENALAAWIVHGWAPMFSAYAPFIIGFSQAVALRLMHTLFAPLSPNSKPTPQ